MTQTWAQVNASNPNALECVPQRVSSPSSLSITGYPFQLSPSSAVSATAGANTYTFPSYAGLNGTFSSYSGTTASVRVGGPSGTLVCLSLQRSGSSLYLVLLGGEGFSVAQQCSPSASSLVPNAFNTPFCATLNSSSNAPYKSTVLGVYTLQSGGSSGASSAAFALSAAALAAGAVALLL
jgi:hypothetical protein